MTRSVDSTTASASATATETRPQITHEFVKADLHTRARPLSAASGRLSFASAVPRDAAKVLYSTASSWLSSTQACGADIVDRESRAGDRDSRTEGVVSQSQELSVIGGGLVGSLLAVCLARRGHRVSLYESRPDIRSVSLAAGRSINLIGTSRCLHAAAQVGLEDKVRGIGVAVLGRMMHDEAGALHYQPYGKDDSEFNYSLSRGELNQLLLQAADDHDVKLHFEHRLQEANLETGVLTFEDSASGESRVVQSQRVFGTDGAGSALRAAFEGLDGFESSFADLGHGYKELLIPALADGSAPIDGDALHIWPRGSTMLMALANRGGSFTVTIYQPNEGEWSFASIRTEADVRELFEAKFADAIALIPDLENDYLQRPTGVLGTRRCSRFHHGGRALLLGDAAHAIVPFHGQGMNCGFEDCTVLMELVDAGLGWDEAFEEFTRLRKPNADAIADMSLDNFVEMCERVGDPKFLLRKAVEHRLENELPGEYRTRYSMVTYSRIPYRVAIQAGRIQQSILDRICQDLDRVEDVDMKAARSLIAAELTPFLEEHSVDLAY